jgi:hypothetical protein
MERDNIMALKYHLKALLLKNWLLWRRNKLGSCCEILVPAALLSILMLMRLAFPAHHESGESYAYPNHLDTGTAQVIVPPMYEDALYLAANTTMMKDSDMPFQGLYSREKIADHLDDTKKVTLRWPINLLNTGP